MRIKKITANLEKMAAFLKISKFQVANYLFLCQLYKSTIVRNFMLVSQFALSSQKIEFIRPTILAMWKILPTHAWSCNYLSYLLFQTSWNTITNKQTE